MAGMTEAQQKAFEDALARSKAKEETREAVPTQRVRAFSQGISFGTADEIEARAVSLATGRPYSEILDEIRGGLKAYKGARPGEAALFEIGGALLPALVPGGQASVVRAAGRGALEGAAYAFGTGEGSGAERLERLPMGLVGGAAGGSIGYGAGKAIGSSANKLADAARRKLGGRGSTIVENEIQRLVKQTGRTPDQVTQDIMDGRVLAENKSIQAAVRALRAQGGEASTTIESGLAGRAGQKRAAAMAGMRQGMGDIGEGSQVAARRTNEAATAAAERAAFGRLEGVPLPDEAFSALADTLKRVPSAAKEVEIKLRAETGAAPFFEVSEGGVVSFTRRPTAMEAESVRRAVGNRATSLYRQEGMGGAGEAVSEVQKGFREILDYSIPELASTRAQAAAIRANRDAYTAGAKALAGDVNEKLADFAELQQGPNAAEAVASFRAGFMQALEGRAATGSRQSMIRNLADPDNLKEGMLLREVFPQDQLDEVLKSLDIASDAQTAASRVLAGTGSQTADVGFEAARQGMGLNASEIAGVVSGSPVETMNVASKLIGRFFRSDLTDTERNKIAQILVSTDPQIVRNAVIDESGMQKFADAVAKAAIAARGGARGVAATQTGEFAGENYQPIMVPREPLRIGINPMSDQ
tara:strand:- start:45 stop:1976 length:1932 start_codon:yes stop_codon:yes gene_type:complete